MKKRVILPLGIVVTGMVIMSFTFVYYRFHLGVKPCTGSTLDAANCGDGDFGGLYFLITGAFVIFIGTIWLLVGSVKHYLKHRP
jgi:hypothetical protein